MSSRDEGGDEPLVELVHRLQVHVVGLPHVLIHQVQGGVGDELVQVPVVVLPQRNAEKVKATASHLVH